MALQVNLGKLAFCFQGDWDGSRAYTRLDVVQHGNKVWVSSGQADRWQTPGEHSVWQLMLSGPHLYATESPLMLVSSQVWTVPQSGCYEIICQGGGGGGGGGYTGGLWAGGGGAGGETVSARLSLEADGKIPVTIGAGGNGGLGLINGNNFASGQDGGSTFFGKLLSAKGGGGGIGWNSGNNEPVFYQHAGGKSGISRQLIKQGYMRWGCQGDDAQTTDLTAYEHPMNAIFSGKGGDSCFGYGGWRTHSDVWKKDGTNGLPGEGYGAGGSGGSSYGKAWNGGNGTSGCVSITRLA